MILTWPAPLGAPMTRSWYRLRSRSAWDKRFFAPLDGPHMLSAMVI
jgi:hypothetical protein